MKDLSSRIKDGKIHLKLFSSPKASQLNHYIKPTLQEYKYDCAIIHVDINDILRNKNNTFMNNLSNSYLEIENTCQMLEKYSSLLYYHQSKPKAIYHKSIKS